MTETYQQLFTDSFLLSNWNTEYQTYLKSVDAEILEILRNWNDKNFQKETEAEGTFVDIFFKKIWNYTSILQFPECTYRKSIILIKLLAEGFLSYKRFFLRTTAPSGGST